MTEFSSSARFYLAPPQKCFWRWGENGQVITWGDGATIAFRQEIAYILQRLAPQGLPPLGSLVLLLAACREDWPTQVSQIRRSAPEESLAAVLQGLERIHTLPANLRQGLEIKAALAEMVFSSGLRRSSPDAAQLVCQALTDGIFIPDASPRPGLSLEKFHWHNDFLMPLIEEVESHQQPPQNDFLIPLADLEAFGDGLAGVNPDSLALYLKTGLDCLVRPANLDLSPPEQVRQLLNQLREDRELAGLSRLAHQLMAAVAIPRPVSAHEELSVGGVSDIANKGSLDCLLASELAHDDLTLAVRIASHEALYLRRESPPRTPPGLRAILIDVGIRLWGIPRLFAAAVALALVATADRHGQVFTFRSQEQGISPIDLTTREGLTAHLSALEAAPHPAGALGPFFQACQKKAAHLEAMIITQQQVLEDVEFRQAMLSYTGERTFYVATVEREGTYRLFALSRRGQKLLREAHLSLAELFALPPQKPALPVRSADADPQLPLILSLEPFPLILPHPIEPQLTDYSPQYGMVSVTRDGRLMHWPKVGWGARQITASLPSGRIHWLAIDEEGIVHVVITSSRHRIWALTADLVRGACFGMELRSAEGMYEILQDNPDLPNQPGVRLEQDTSPLIAVWQTAGMIFLIFQGRIDRLAGHTSQCLQSLPIQGVKWRGGRYFQDHTSWYCLTYDGAKHQLEQASTRDVFPLQAREYLAFFDREGHGGPWAVTNEGWIALATWDFEGPAIVPPEGKIFREKDRTEIRFNHGLIPPLGLLSISRDGHRLVLRGLHGMSKTPLRVLFDLEKGTSRNTYYYGTSHAMVEHYVSRCPTLRHRFTAIGESSGSLVLRSQSHHYLYLGLDAQGKKMVLLHEPTSPKNLLSFEAVRGPQNTRYSLGVASWKDGSRAYLDSRGLLHLKSSDPRVPEVTIILNDGELAAWSSDGLLCGPSFFTGDRPTVESHDIFEHLQRFLARLPV